MTKLLPAVQYNKFKLPTPFSSGILVGPCLRLPRIPALRIAVIRLPTLANPVACPSEASAGLIFATLRVHFIIILAAPEDPKRVKFLSFLSSNLVCKRAVPSHSACPRRVGALGTFSLGPRVFVADFDGRQAGKVKSVFNGNQSMSRVSSVA